MKHRIEDLTQPIDRDELGRMLLRTWHTHPDSQPTIARWGAVADAAIEATTAPQPEPCRCRLRLGRAVLGMLPMLVVWFLLTSLIDDLVSGWSAVPLSAFAALTVGGLTGWLLEPWLWRPGTDCAERGAR